MRTVAKIFFILLIVVAVGFVIFTILGNTIWKGDDGKVTTPDIKQAPYAITVNNTGHTFLTKNYERFGDTVGSRTYVLHGYWELQGRNFNYKSSEFVISEKVFGEVTAKKRGI